MDQGAQDAGDDGGAISEDGVSDGGAEAFVGRFYRKYWTFVFLSFFSSCCCCCCATSLGEIGGGKISTD